MIGVDTDVLLRPALPDDPEQLRRVEAFFRARSERDPAFVSIIALTEFVWTLRRRERRSAAEVRALVLSLLNDDAIVVQFDQEVIRALDDAEETGADFADALVAHLGLRHDCDYTVTLDRRAGGLPGMKALDPA